jgi:4-hydroxybenzoate polyprenyltransferase
MNEKSICTPYTGLGRVKLFWALSRTPHGLLDMTTPAFAALLWLGTCPSWYITVLGLMTTFAGYTSVYALNDVVDYRIDKEKLQRGGFQDSDNYLDAVMVRHPMAQGLLSFREGLMWSAAWGILAVLGAYLLNPACVVIFMSAAVLETIYCLLWRVSHLRTIVSGAVKTSGAIAAVFAVDPKPSPIFLLILFLGLFFWEIGGQNIPADWTDIEEDRQLNARTIPVRFGLERANLMIIGSIILALLLNAILFLVSPVRFEIPYILASMGVGCYLLLMPALRLYKTQARREAMVLFNKASYYPAALFVVVTIKSVI